jgi:hypothetical protein
MAFMFIASPQFIGMAFALSIIENPLPNLQENLSRMTA